MKRPADHPTLTLDGALDAGLAAAFGKDDLTAGGWTRPPLLRDEPSDYSPIVRPDSNEMAKADANRYQLFGEIARGGMGVILKGRDPDLGRDLAVKVLRTEFTGKAVAEQRFVEEAQVGGQLQHPGVVPVYELGRFTDGRPYFTMKLVKGRTLSALLADRPSPQTERGRFLKVFEQIAQTIAYAHSKGVIHRDIKPANVMVGSFGEVQVMDWGLAKVLPQGGVADEKREQTTRTPRPADQPDEPTVIRTVRTGSTAGSETEAGSMMGTPAYMPPEQAGGEMDKLDERADVFGLGAVLCVILTGDPPYVSDNAEKLRLMALRGNLDDCFQRLDTCGADDELLLLIKRCLAKDPTDRPRHAGEVATAIHDYLAHVEERVHKAELAEAAATAETKEQRKRQRVQLALAASVLAFLTLGGGGWLWLKSERDARTAQTTRDVNDALNKANGFREQVKAAHVGGAALYAQAREQAQRALALVENGPADAALATRVRHLQSELEEEEKDRKLIATLERAVLAQSEMGSTNDILDQKRALPVFREAFRAYGLPAGEGPPEAAAERIRQRPAAVREAIFAVLDEWDFVAGDFPRFGVTEPNREWLRSVLDAAEPEDAWSRQARVTRAETDLAKRRDALEKLAASADVGQLPARALTRLASRLDPAPKVALLRRAQPRYPADFFVNHGLGIALGRVTPPQRDEAVRFLTAAVALRPNNPFAHSNLGVVLKENGRVDEALACFMKAIELDPKNAGFHVNLGATLADGKKDYDSAVECFKKAIELDPKFANAHNNLGSVLREKGQVDEAFVNIKKAIELDPKFANAHNNLGVALQGKGQVDEAIVSYKKAIELDPKDFVAHYNLGIALRDRGQLEEAIVSYKKAIEHDPKNALAHNSLGLALMAKDQIEEALVSFKKAIEYDPRLAAGHINLAGVLQYIGQLDEAIVCYKKVVEFDPKNALARTYLANVERLAAARDKLPAYQNGRYTPASNDERISLAEWCRVKKLNHTASSLYTIAFATDPKLPDELQYQHRFNAACNASLAAAGQGEDAAKLDDKDRARLRNHTLDWLRADLSAYSKRLASGNAADRKFVRQRMQHWQQDADLASLRDASALATLPSDEQKVFTQLWADVADLLKKTDTPPAAKP